MRFLRLDLRAFGPFADAPPIDLSGGSRGLHLIHGPNEAGKSSSLRAIRCLLFGYPVRLKDNQRHKNTEIRLGATLQSEQGAEISFLRRKRDVSPLWTFDDSEVISEQTLGAFLGNLDRTKFDEFFAMDHAELVAGGQAILQGKGNLGSMLFAAGSGLAGIDSIRKALEAEIDELFKPAGRNPTINAALAQLGEARKASEQAMLATTDWVDLDATLTRERSRKAAIDAQIRLVETEKHRLERLRDALPILSKIAAIRDTLAEYGDSPVLADGFADRRYLAETARIASSKSAEAALAALEAIARDLDALGPRDVVLDQTDAIRRLRDDLGLYRKAQHDRPIEQSKLARREADALAILAELRPGGSLDDADSIRIPASLKGRIQGLAQDLAGLEAKRSHAENEVAKLLAASPGVDRQGVSPDVLRRAETLSQTTRQIQAQGDLEALLASNLDELARFERQASVDLKSLPLWSGTLEALEALTVPSNTTIDKFEVQLRGTDDSLARFELELKKLESERTKLDRAIDRQQTTGTVPSDEELAARRDDRDASWREIRRSWLDREPVEAPVRVADAFEAHIKTSDDLADRLRREAEAVAEQARKKERRRELADEIAQAIADRDRARSHRGELEQTWIEIWRTIGIEPLSPREMRDWVAIDRAKLVRVARELRERKLDCEGKSSRIDKYKDDVGGLLEGFGEPPAEPRESLGSVLSRANAMVQRVNTGLSLQGARSSLEKAEAELAECRTRWASAVKLVGLQADATSSEVLAVIGRFDELSEILREIAGIRSKIDDQVQVASRFETDAKALIERLGIDESEALLESFAVELDRRLKASEVVEVRREDLLKRQVAERSKLEKARDELGRGDAALEALVSEAGCGSVEGLSRALQVSDEIKRHKTLLRSYEEQLERLAGSTELSKLREQAEGVDSETIRDQLDQLAEELDPLLNERTNLDEVIVRCRVKLEAMNGGPDAANAQQLVEEQVARLANHVEKYARLRIASAVLREAVERYRKEHQGPILERAGALFASLTAGSFQGLRADLDDKGEPILLGVRSDGTTLLNVEGMSEGTADQLYLALRLASLQTYLDAHEPMPLVVDDILVNFDNVRALAALQALAELSKRTQILFFTHHEHLVDLARTSLPDDVLFVHHLPFPPVSVVEANGSTPEVSIPKRKKRVIGNEAG